MTAPTRRYSCLATVLAVVALIMATLSPAHAAPTVLDHGHADIFNVTATSGSLRLSVKEDVTGHGVIRDPEDVVLKVKPEALTDFTGDFSRFGANGYMLPLVQDPALLWPGWDTQGVVAGGFSAVDIVFDEVTGPGDVYLFTQGSGLGGGIAPLLNGGDFQLRSGSVRHQNPPAHTHAYWIFSQPGTYTMRVFARSGATQTATHTYTWQVGNTTTVDDSPSGDGSDDSTSPTTTSTAATTTHTTSSTPKPPAFNALDDPWLNSPAAEGFSSSSGSSSRPVVVTTVTRARPVAEQQVHSDHDHSGHNHEGHNHSGHSHSGHDHSGHDHAESAAVHACHPVAAGDQLRLLPIIRDDRVTPAKDIAPDQVTFVLGDEATATTTQPIGVIPANARVWMIGSTQVPGVPWLGMNTMNPSLMGATNQPVRMTLTGFTGPGDLEVFTSGNFGQVVGERWFSATPGSPSGSVSIDPNTHVHPNWVFTEPGSYEVTITQEVTTRDGVVLTVPATLHFAVGVSAGGVTSGHFDFGAAVATTTTTEGRTDSGEPCDLNQPTVSRATSQQPATTAPPAAAAASGSRSGLARTGVDNTALPLGFAALSIVLFGATVLFTRRRKATQ